MYLCMCDKDILVKNLGWMTTRELVTAVGKYGQCVSTY